MLIRDSGVTHLIFITIICDSIYINYSTVNANIASSDVVAQFGPSRGFDYPKSAIIRL